MQDQYTLPEATCLNFDRAELALNNGLSPSRAVCPWCKFKDECDYQDQMQDARIADHRVATHSRASLSFDDIVEDRKYVSIHEDPITIFRQTIDIRKVGHLQAMKSLFAEASKQCRDMYYPVILPGSGVRMKTSANDHRLWFWEAEKTVQDLISQFEAATTTTPVVMPDQLIERASIQRIILDTIAATYTTPPDLNGTPHPAGGNNDQTQGERYC